MSQLLEIEMNESGSQKQVEPTIISMDNIHDKSIRTPTPSKSNKKVDSSSSAKRSRYSLYLAIVVLIGSALLFVVGAILIGVFVYQLAFSTMTESKLTAQNTPYLFYVPIIVGAIFLVTSVLGVFSALTFRAPKAQLFFSIFVLIDTFT